MENLPKGPAILVSSVNMLLRDEEFGSLESLCHAFNRTSAIIEQTSEEKQDTREATMLTGVIGGGIGAWSGIKAWHHQTVHKGGNRDVDDIVGGRHFSYGVPLILVVLMALLFLSSCKTKQSIEEVMPFPHESIQEHSPSVLIIMYDRETGKEPLLKAVKGYKAEVIYDYSIIPGMAVKKPDDRTLEEAMQYFKKVKGVVSVEYDHIYHLTDPVKPKLEIESWHF